MKAPWGWNRVTGLKRVTLLVMVVWLTPIGVVAQPGGRPYTENITGTLSSSTLDRNADGVPASISTFSGNSNFGKVHGQSSFEVTVFGAPVNCAVDEVEATLVGTRDVRRFPDHGDMIFLEVSDLLVCLNPLTGIFTVSSQGHFIGGTGRYSGATGDFTGSFTGAILVADPNGALFGAFSGGVTGTVETP